MRKISICLLALAAASAASTAKAQQWDLGVVGGYGFANDLTVKNATASATAGFKNGSVVGVYGGEELYPYFSGEMSYLYQRSNLKLSNAGQSETFDAHSHLFTFDMLAHLRPKGARFRPFISVGAGVKDIVATGDEGVPQPLGASCFTANATCFAALTATHEIQVVGEVGIGVKLQLRKHIALRAQVRDYISPSPNQVIAAGPGASVNGLLHDIIATGAVGLTW